MPELYSQVLDLKEKDVFLETEVNDTRYFSVTGLPSTLSYGKHPFALTFNDPEGQPLLKNLSNIIFEFVDSRGTVIFTDIIDIEELSGAGNGFVWIKKDPLRTSDEIADGPAYFYVMGELEGNGIPNQWKGLYNVRSTFEYDIRKDYPNTSNLILKNSLGIQTNLNISESIEFDSADSVFKRSFINVSLTDLETNGGKIDSIELAYNEQKARTDEYEIITRYPIVSGSYETDDQTAISGLNPITNTTKIITPKQFRRNTPVRFRLRFVNPAGQLAQYLDENRQGEIVEVTSSFITFEGSPHILERDDNLLSGSMYTGNAVGKGFEQSGKSSAYLKTVDYEGFVSASVGSGSAGIMFFSGSVLPSSGDNYGGVGLELHGGKGSGSFRFRTNPSLLEIQANTFFVGSENTQFISGSGGQIEISSSDFHLTPQGQVTASAILLGSKTDGQFLQFVDGALTVQGSITADSIRTPSSIGGAPSTDQNASSSISSQGFATFKSASIGGFIINPSQIKSTDSSLILNSDGKITGSAVLFGDKTAGQFVQFSDNTLTVQGDITANNIRTPATIGGSPSTDANASASINTQGFAKFVSASIGGFDVGTGGFTLGGSNVNIDSTNKVISINDSTFGNTGIQLDFNSGTPRAFIGKAGGEFIKFDGSAVNISSSAFFIGGGGQFISGANQNIEISSSAFHLDPKNNILVISGTINAGAGNIGDFQIIDGKISGSNITFDANRSQIYKTDQGPGSDTSAAFNQLRDEYYIDFTPSSSNDPNGTDYYIKMGANFMVDKSGILIASGGLFEGTISASAGSIGGFLIESSSIRSKGGTTFISGSPSNSDFFIKSPNFNIKGSGDVTGSSVLFTGGKIGGLTIDTNEVKVGTVLRLKDSGQITGSNVLFSGGKIAGFDISGTKLQQDGSFHLDGDASADFFISSSNFQVTPNGDITGSSALFDGNTTIGGTLTVNGTGEIAGFGLTSNAISSSNDNLILKSTGQITGSEVLFTGGKIADFSITSTQISDSDGDLILKSNGQITASAANIIGTVTSTAGAIGGFNITDTAIKSTNNAVELSSALAGLFIKDGGGTNRVIVKSGSLGTVGGGTQYIENKSFEDDSISAGRNFVSTINSWSFSEGGSVNISLTDRSSYPDDEKAVSGDVTLDVVVPAGSGNYSSPNTYEISQVITASSNIAQGDTISFSSVARFSSSFGGRGKDRALGPQYFRLEYSGSGTDGFVPFLPANEFTASNGYGEYFLGSGQYSSFGASADLPGSAKFIKVIITGSINDDTGFTIEKPLFAGDKGTVNSDISGRKFTKTVVGSTTAEFPETEITFDNFSVRSNTRRVELTEDGLLIYNSEDSFIKMSGAGIELRGGSGLASFGSSINRESFTNDSQVAGTLGAPALQPYTADPEDIGTTASDGNVAEFAKGNHVHRLTFSTINSILNGNTVTNGTWNSGFGSTAGTLISGSFTAPSSSFSTRITTLEGQDIDDDLNFAGDSGTGTIDLDTETFTIAGGNGLSSVASGNSVTLNMITGILSSSAQISDDISGSLGTNATLIRGLTSAKISGSFTAPSSSFSTRVTNLKTDSGSFSTRITTLEGQDIDDDLNFAGDSGTGTIDLDTETLTIAGGAGMSSVASGNSVTLNLDTGILSSSAQISTQISGSLGTNASFIRGLTSTSVSGSFTAPSSSFSTRVTNLETDSGSFSARLTTAESELNNTLISSSAQIADEISGSFTAASSSFSSRVTTLEGLDTDDDLTVAGDSGGNLSIDLDSETLTIAGGTGIDTSGDTNTITVTTNDSEIVHDNLSGFVANEHIDHSTVSVIAGDGLTGGGTIAANRTLNIGAGTGIDVAANAISVDVSDFMTNGSDNRIVTATGTDAMNAEANLIFDGTNLLAGGITSANGIGLVTPIVQVEGTTANSALSIVRNSNSISPPYLMLGKSRGTSLGSDAIVQNGDVLGAIRFNGADGTDRNSYAAEITAEVDGAPGSNDMPGRLIFETTSDGASTSTERMRIDSSGNVIFQSDNAKISGSATSTGSFGRIFSADSANIAGLEYPTADGDDGSVFMTNGSGVITLESNVKYVNVKNVETHTLSKGTPVHATGTTGNTPEVVAASASISTKMPATFVLAEQLTAGSEGRAVLSGFLNGIDTSGFTEGNNVYVGADGGYTESKPTGTNLIQNIAIVGKVDGSNGSIFVYGSGRSNDVPNLLNDHIFFGSGSDQMQQLHISGAIDHATLNDITFVGDISGSSTSTGSFSSLVVADKVQGDLHIRDQAGIGVSPSTTYALQLQQPTGTNNDYIQGIQDNGSNTAFRINTDSGDNVSLRLYNGSGAQKIHLNAGGTSTFEGSISGSSTSTGSFGRVESSTSNVSDNAFIGNRLGIGTTSPATELHLASSEPIIRFTDTDDNNYHHIFASSDDFYISADRNGTGAGNLIFRNNGTNERMRIDSSGRLGIGEASPDSPLHLTYADNTTSTTATGAGQQDYGVKIENTSTTNGAFSQLHLRAGTADGYIRYIYEGTANTGRLGFFVDNANDVKEAFSISNDGKQISGSSTSTGSFGGLETAGNSRFSGHLDMGTKNITNWNTLQSQGNLYLDNGGFIDSRGSGDLTFRTTDSVTTRMVIKNAGNVGIGTTDPEGKLHIYSGDAGGSSAIFNQADELVIENSNHAGITIKSPNDKETSVFFGDQDDSSRGGIRYDHATDKMKFQVAVTSLELTSTKISGSSSSTGSFGAVSIGKGTADNNRALTIVGNVQLNNNNYIYFKRSNGNADPHITYDSSNNFKIFNPVSGEIQLMVGSAEIVAIDGGGLTFNGSKTIGSSAGSGVITILGNSGLKLKSGGGGGSGPIELIQGSTTYWSVGASGALTGSAELVMNAGKNISGSSTSTGSFGAGYIDNKLGIGTSSPSYELHTTGDTFTTEKFLILQNKLIQSRNSVGAGNFGNSIKLKNSSTGNMEFTLENDAYDFTFTNGKVGIGTTTPTEKLYVAGNIFATENISGSSTSTGSFGKILQNGQEIAIGQSVGTTDDVTFNDITFTGDLSGSITSTGSFGRVHVADKLGIQTTTPRGSIDVKGSTGTQGFYLSSAGTAVYLPSDIIHSGGSSNFDIQPRLYRLGTSTGGPVTIHPKYDSMLKLGTSDDTDLLVLSGSTKISGSSTSTGSFGSLYVDNRIGLGITNPQAYDTAVKNPVVIGAGASGGNNAGISVISSTGGYGTLYFGDGTGAAVYRGAVEYNHSDDSLKIWTAGTAGSGIAITIDSSNNTKFAGNIISTKANGLISGSSTSTGSFGQVTLAGTYGIKIQDQKIGTNSANHVGTSYLGVNSGASGNGSMNLNFVTSNQTYRFINYGGSDVGGENYAFYLRNNNTSRNPFIVVPSAADNLLTLANSTISGSATSTGSFGRVDSHHSVITHPTSAQLLLTDSGESSDPKHIRIRNEAGDTYIEALNNSYATHKTPLKFDNNTGHVQIMGGQDATFAQLSVQGIIGINNSNNSAGIRLGYSSTDTTFKIMDTTDGSTQFSIANTTGDIEIGGDISGSLTSTGSFGVVHAEGIRGLSGTYGGTLFVPEQLALGNDTDTMIRKYTSNVLEFRMGGQDLIRFDGNNGKVIVENANLEPQDDDTRNLGASDKRWSDVFAVQTTTGGVFETGLRTEKIGDNPTGTIVSWREDGLVPCDSNEDELVMGVIKEGKDEPIVMGAEPVLVTGKVEVGDYIVTSDKIGHGKSVKRGYLLKKDLFGKVIAQALESCDGDSNLIKCMIRKM